MRICQYFKPISISLSPNTEPDDIRLAIKLKFQPWRWKKGKEINLLEREFKNYLGVKYAFSFNSGRSALLAILEALNIKEGDEVLLQGFTCNAAVNPILNLKANPIFVDIDDGSAGSPLNLDTEDLERKITKKSKVVMIQHTFGNPAKIDEIKEICKENDLFLIEDCAHSLGAEYQGRKVGAFGDAAFFSFGRDKIISSVYGGMAVSNNDKIGERLKEIQDNLSFPSNGWILQQILHPMIFSLALPVFSFLKTGKAILYLCQKLKILSSSVYSEEKKGKVAKYFPKKMPNALAILALNQFRKLERFNKHRRKIAGIYNREFARMKVRICANKESIYMRYSIFMENTEEVREKLKKQNILLDDGWHTLPIVPRGTDLKKMRYQKGSCKNAEEVAKTILNLPTGIKISKKDAEKIAKLVGNRKM